MPKSHVWDPETAQICNSVGRVGIRQAKETPDPSEYFLVEAGRGDRRLKITLDEKEVVVAVRMDSAQWKNGSAPVKLYLTSWYYRAGAMAPPDDLTVGAGGQALQPGKYDL